MWNEQEKKNSIVLFDKRARYSKFWKSSQFHWSNSWSSNRVKKKRRKHSPVVKGGGGGGDRSEGTGILVDGAKHPFVLVKSSVQKSNEDESAPEKYSLTSKARRTKDTLFISLPFIASIPSRFTPSPLPNRFHDFPPLRDKVVPRFRHSRIIENAHVNTVKTKIIFASSSFSLKNRDRERERGGGGKWRNNGACSVLRDYHPKSDPLSQEGETGGSCAISAVRMPHARDPFRRLWIYIQGITRGRTIVSMVFVFFGRWSEGEKGWLPLQRDESKVARCPLRRNGGSWFQPLSLPPLHAIIKSYLDDRFFPLIDLLPPWEKNWSNSVQYLKFVNVRSRELSRYVQ